MAVLVQKYGGTSVGSPERIQHVAERIVRTRRRGAELVVVVPALGDDKDEVIGLAAALKATECEIYTDVDGVYTADPRVVPGARKITRLSYDEMLELASLGAKVLHNRSVEIARRFDVPVHVRSSFNWNEGSRVV